MKIITLLTDFGEVDGYVGSLKGVILSINPEVNIVDITHYVIPFNIMSASYLVKSYAKYYPKDTIHIIVVDPGVGTKRKPIILKTPIGIFVAPDNKVLSFIAAENKKCSSYIIENKKYLPHHISNTFHGRDIFAYAAGYISLGTKPSEFGREIKSIQIDKRVNPIVDTTRIIGEVIHIDSFGNLITNIQKKHLSKFQSSKLTVKVGGCNIVGLSKTFSDVRAHELLTFIGSSSHLEIGLNKGNASKFLNVNFGSEVIIRGKLK